MGFKEQYFEIWRQVWEFHKKYSNVSGTDEYWERLVAESGKIVEQYRGLPQYEFIKNLRLAIIGEIERIDKRRRISESEK